MSPAKQNPNPPRLWRSLAEYDDEAAFAAQNHDEFAETLPIPVPDPTLVQLKRPSDVEPPRRDFFKMMGLSAAAAMAACNRAPKQNILPYTHRPEAIIPGLAVHYATSCQACAARCGLLIKTREGRPIKIEGNPTHPVSQGAVCTVGQAWLLGLYDNDRARAPRAAAHAATWAQVDAEVTAALAKAANVFVVLPFGTGPAEDNALAALKAKFAQTKLVRFDPMGERMALAQAHAALYARAYVPDYRIDESRVLVSFGADFLGTWVNPATFSRQWAQARRTTADRLFAAQIESHLSLTGGAADVRHPVPPSALRPTLAALVSKLAAAKPGATADVANTVCAQIKGQSALANAALEELAARLLKAGPQGLVLSGSGEVTDQILAALANALLENAGTTARPGVTQSSDIDWEAFVAELQAGHVDAVVFAGTNPVMADRQLQTALSKAKFSVSTSISPDETAVLCHIHAPEGHALESWSDSEPRPGVHTINQPTVSPLFDTRGRLQSLLTWAGTAGDDHAFVQAAWKGKLASVENFDAAWIAQLQAGALATAFAPAPAAVQAPAASLIAAAAAPGNLEVVLHAQVGILDGTHANNGWLQELPDPITKLTWGNVAAMGPALAKELGLGDGALITVTRASQSITLPVLVQAGVAPHTVAIAVGHGRAHAGKNAEGHGVDAWPLATNRSLSGAITVQASGGKRDLYLSQTHNSQEGRAFVRAASLEDFLHDPKHAGQPEEHEATGKGLWPQHAYPGHRWGLAIDLDKCTGCGACVVSCQAENNIPMVGPVEVALRREMHWLRIDRYYEGEPENPEVRHQPMMCQHCENAPCETVCPVLATVHSSEGLNQQIYNRCVGTRYCANNCPTKVRRFNWFDYPHDQPLERMVLNPDVVVRTRGVMEK
ncbi:MAG: TAT-variant-translocated molybdopterin oxidoreductase, partial [Deltaproteobacteria bacterium]|nr:TAT-variant-translocated molybdopterin oxidoreductase [Deltaproteobacteria bacterium]